MAVLYAVAPRLRRGVLVICGLGASLLLGIGFSLIVDARDGPVVDAVDNRNPAALKRALDAGGSARADVGIDLPCPVLFKAIGYGDVPSVEILLQHGADPNERGNDQTPLEAASGNGKITQVLKRYGAR